MNVFGMLNAMQNPQAFAFQQMAQQMIQQNPEQWSAAQQMMQDKSRKQQINELQKLYKSKGLDLASTAQQYGISL